MEAGKLFANVTISISPYSAKAKYEFIGKAKKEIKDMTEREYREHIFGEDNNE